MSRIVRLGLRPYFTRFVAIIIPFISFIYVIYLVGCLQVLIQAKVWEAHRGLSEVKKR